MNTIEQCLQTAAREFRAARFEEPRLEAEVLMAAVLGRDRLYLITHGDAPLTEKERLTFDHDVARRLAHEPAAQITGHREFMGLDFKVTKDVLVPRPDTENIVEAAIDLMKKASGTVKLLDLCTGSGAIGLSIKKYVPSAQVTLSDVSRAALDVAKDNAKQLGLSAQFVLSDGFDKIAETFDMIVTNPPYIPSREIGTLAPDVKDFEPRLALDGGADGLNFYRRLFNEAPAHLKTGGTLILECGYDQAAVLKAMSAKHAFSCERLIKDLAGLDRGLVLKKIE